MDPVGSTGLLKEETTLWLRVCGLGRGQVGLSLAAGVYMLHGDRVFFWGLLIL